MPPFLPSPDYDKIMHIAGRWGIAQACPAGDRVYTAAHNIEPFLEYLGEVMPYAWEDDLGNAGYLLPIEFNHARDVVRANTWGDSPMYYPIALEEVQVGDWVTWVEYGKRHERVIRTATVFSALAGKIYFDQTPNPGASGSCLLNRRGAVVGVVVWGHDDHGGGEQIVGRWAL